MITGDDIGKAAVCIVPYGRYKKWEQKKIRKGSMLTLFAANWELKIFNKPEKKIIKSNKVYPS